jgi:hypothetical protein
MRWVEVLNSALARSSVVGLGFFLLNTVVMATAKEARNRLDLFCFGLLAAIIFEQRL